MLDRSSLRSPRIRGCLERGVGRGGATPRVAYEGTFRKATIYKGRNRDTAWYAVVDDDWPRIRGAVDAWLAPADFDDGGRQMSPLRAVADAG